MGWGARFFGAGRESPSGADLGSLNAATAGVSALKQAVEERRLDAKIANADHDWRAILEIGPLAAPLWLAETLVWLAQTFYGAEADSHPDHPDHPAISPLTHQLISSLLAPVEDIIADVTAALADPTHHTKLIAPVHIGPGAAIVGGELPQPLSVMYVNGLVKATRGIHTSAMSALVETQKAIAQSSPPDWLHAGLQRLDGTLQAAGARLDMIELRIAPLLMDERTARNNQETLAAVCADLWTIVDTALVAGQSISDPHIMPEAHAANVQRVAPPQSAPHVPHAPYASPQTLLPHERYTIQPIQQPRQIAPGIPPSPLQPTQSIHSQPEPSLALPEIAEGAPFTSASLAPTAPPSSIASPPSDTALPTIGANPDAPPAQPITTLPAISSASAENPAPAMPDVGSDAPSPAPSSSVPASTEPHRRIPAEDGDKPPTLFPDIG